MLESYALVDVAETISQDRQEKTKVTLKAKKACTFNWVQELDFETHHARYSKKILIFLSKEY